MMTKQRYNRLNQKLITDTKLVIRFGLIYNYRKDGVVTVHFGFFKAPKNAIYLIKHGIFYFNSISKDWNERIMFMR